MNRTANRRAKITDRLMTTLIYLIGGAIIVFLVVLSGYIVIRGFQQFKPAMLSTDRIGILNPLFNTVYLVFLSLLAAVPIGIGAGIYLAEYAHPGRLLDIVRISIQSLSSLPSIVVGLFGYLVFILMTGMKWNLLAGALSVAILCLPLIATETENALAAQPAGYKEGSLALGASYATTIFRVLIPAAMPQIITGVIMAAGRGFGEAAALLYTAGQSTVINWSNWNPTSITSPWNPLRPGETLALHIWVLRTEGSLNPDAAATAGFASAILVILTFLFSWIARLVSSSIRRHRMNV